MNSEKNIITQVGITGVSGNIGKTLVESLSNKYCITGYDIMPCSSERKDFESIVVDLSDAKRVRGLFDGLDAVIHLAADTDPESPWESILRNNILVTYNVFEEAHNANIKKIVFASTNHVQHGNTIKTRPETLDPAIKIKMKLNDLPNPDSLYAVSKLFGEDLGLYYARRFNLKFIALRIGWTIPEDNPLVKKGTIAEDYMRAMFLSKRDCVEAFTKALELDTDYLVAYAVSNNDGLVFDLKETREKLGFYPKDNSENYF